MSNARQWFLAMSVITVGGCAVTATPHSTPADGGAITWLRDADAAYENQQWATAESKYRELTRRFPNDAHAFFRLGNALVQQARYDEAAQAYQAAAQREPRFTKAYSNLATVYLIQANAAAAAALASLPAQDPAGALLALRHNEIERIAGIPVDEAKGSGKVLQVNRAAD